jgi:hypothetical protein
MLICRSGDCRYFGALNGQEKAIPLIPIEAAPIAYLNAMQLRAGRDFRLVADAVVALLAARRAQ